MAKSRQTRTDYTFGIVNGIILMILFCVILYPLIFVISASFSNPALVNTGKIILIPRGVTLDGYKKVLAYGEIWQGYANTVFYTLFGTLLNLLATLPAAYALSRRDLALRGGIMTFFLIPMYFSGGLIPGYLNVQSLGLLNTRTYILISGLISTYNLIVSRTFFASTIPWEIHEAAFMDGSSDLNTFVKLILPMSKPIIVVMALYYGVGRWNSYFTEMIYLNDRAMYPLQLFLREILISSQISQVTADAAVDLDPAALQELYRQADIANLMKYCVIVVSTLPMMLIYPWLQRFFAKGVMIGAVKG